MQRLVVCDGEVKSAAAKQGGCCGNARDEPMKFSWIRTAAPRK